MNKYEPLTPRGRGGGYPTLSGRITKKIYFNSLEIYSTVLLYVDKQKRILIILF